jgi:hypothetical protein
VAVKMGSHTLSRRSETIWDSKGWSGSAGENIVGRVDSAGHGITVGEVKMLYGNDLVGVVRYNVRPPAKGISHRILRLKEALIIGDWLKNWEECLAHWADSYRILECVWNERIENLELDRSKVRLGIAIRTRG